MEKTTKILIIEDDPDTTEAMRVTLASRGYDVSFCSEPEEGLLRARAEKPQLIILDVMFGKKQEAKGFDCALKMKQDKELAGIPILMATAINVRYPGFGFSPEKDREFLPVDEFIEKPVQPQELLQKTGRLLEQKTSRWKEWPKRSD